MIWTIKAEYQRDAPNPMTLTIQSLFMPKGAADGLALSVVRSEVLIMNVESAR
jgi:hypothetical protein